MSRFLDRRLDRLTEYIPGEQPQDMQYIKLNTNELPYPPSPIVLDRLDRAACAGLRLYPDPDCTPLRRRLAETTGVRPENVFVGNGSDEVLNFAFFAYGGDGVRFPDISYGFYRVFGALHGVRCEEMPLRGDWTVDPADYIGCGKTVVLANPNAPTGLCLPADEIARIARSNPDRVVVIDEAYVDFGGESVIPLTATLDNLLVVGTFSKSRALAGARVGFGIGNSELIRDLERIKNTTNPYNINRLSMTAAVAALDSDAYYREKCREIAETRDRTAQALRALGFFVTDSRANFLFARSDLLDGETLYRRLKARGVLVRHFSDARIRDFVRITVGTPEQMERLLQEIKTILDNRTE